jgi:excisionase family DNA binding protein
VIVVLTTAVRVAGGGHQVDRLLVTPEDAAEFLAVGRTKIYELLRTGALESVRIGAARRIPASALTAYVERLRRDEAAKLDGYRKMVS